jgi:hypothetical protein
MPLAPWPLWRGRPIIEVIMTLAQGSQQVVRRLIADTGAGSLRSPSELSIPEPIHLRQLWRGEPIWPRDLNLTQHPDKI